MYIGLASDDQYDQILEEAEMDCEVAGRMMFTLTVSILSLFDNYFVDRAKHQMLANYLLMMLLESLLFF